MTRKERRKAKEPRTAYPKPLPNPAAYYDGHGGEYPESIRMSFANGHTEIYDRRIQQPGPQAYLNIPIRRRRGK